MNELSRLLKACLAVLVFAISSMGCQAESQSINKLTAVQEKQKQKALKAKDKLFEQLLQELMISMSQKGPAASIEICKTKAPKIAVSVGQELDVAIGRTSFKLRNDANRPPEWAIDYVNNRTKDETYVALPDDGLGVLLPIRLKPTCLLCHGPTEQIMPEVKAAIASNYPNDEATGFSEGDLRGYFWVEVGKMLLD